MRLRPPSVPLITIDPFFNVWSPADKLTDVDTAHWTGYTNAILGTVNIDGKDIAKRLINLEEKLTVDIRKFL